MTTIQDHASTGMSKRCPCTLIEQDETCPVGYPSLLCEICDGKGHVPAEKPKCSRCKGKGTEADYFGDEMRCVEVDCSLCGGSGDMPKYDAIWPVETEDDVEALASECGWNNRRYMTTSDYAIWCERMRKFARLAAPLDKEA